MVVGEKEHADDDDDVDEEQVSILGAVWHKPKDKEKRRREKNSRR